NNESLSQYPRCSRITCFDPRSAKLKAAIRVETIRAAVKKRPIPPLRACAPPGLRNLLRPAPDRRSSRLSSSSHASYEKQVPIKISSLVGRDCAQLRAIGIRKFSQPAQTVNSIPGATSSPNAGNVCAKLFQQVTRENDDSRNDRTSPPQTKKC